MLRSNVTKELLEKFLKENNLSINQLFLAPIYNHLEGIDSSTSKEVGIDFKKEERLSVNDALRFINPLINRFYSGEKEDNPFYVLTNSIDNKKVSTLTECDYGDIQIKEMVLEELNDYDNPEAAFLEKTLAEKMIRYIKSIPHASNNITFFDTLNSHNYFSFHGSNKRHIKQCELTVPLLRKQLRRLNLGMTGNSIDTGSILKYKDNLKKLFSNYSLVTVFIENTVEFKLLPTELVSCLELFNKDTLLIKKNAKKVVFTPLYSIYVDETETCTKELTNPKFKILPTKPDTTCTLHKFSFKDDQEVNLKNLSEVFYCKDLICNKDNKLKSNIIRREYLKSYREYLGFTNYVFKHMSKVTGLSSPHSLNRMNTDLINIISVILGEEYDPNTKIKFTIKSKTQFNTLIEGISSSTNSDKIMKLRDRYTKLKWNFFDLHCIYLDLGAKYNPSPSVHCSQNVDLIPEHIIDLTPLIQAYCDKTIDPYPHVYKLELYCKLVKLVGGSNFSDINVNGISMNTTTDKLYIEKPAVSLQYYLDQLFLKPSNISSANDIIVYGFSSKRCVIYLSKYDLDETKLLGEDFTLVNKKLTEFTPLGKQFFTHLDKINNQSNHDSLTVVQKDILTRLKGYLSVENRVLKKAEKLTGIISKRKLENKIKLGIIRSMLGSGTLKLAKYHREVILLNKTNYDKHHIYERELDLLKGIILQCNQYLVSNTLQSLYDCLPINELDYLGNVDIYCSGLGSLGVKNNTDILPELWRAFLDTTVSPYKKNLAENRLVLNGILSGNYLYNKHVNTREDLAKKLFFDLCKVMNTKPALDNTVYVANIEEGVVASYTVSYLFDYIVNEPILPGALLAQGVINRNKTNHTQIKDYVLFNTTEKYNIADLGLTVLNQLNTLGQGWLTTSTNTDQENNIIGNSLLIDKQDNLHDNDSAYNMENAIIECGIYYEQDNLDMDIFNKVAKQHNLDKATLIYKYYNNQ